MTKAKTTAAEAETPPIGTTVDGQDLNAPSGPGASPEPANDPDVNPPSSQTPGAESADQTPPPPTEEQETARREAEAILAAQADLEAAAAAEAERLAQEAAAAAETPALDLNTLTFLAVQIDMLNTTGHRLGLVDELIGLYGADIADRDYEGVTITMQGISIEPADCMENALNNWANAARRAVMEVTT